MHEVEAKSLLTKWNGMNVYRGCTHGCIYCDSRSKCYHFTHPFEDIEVKINAPQLLEKILRSRRQRCMIGSGSMADPYQPCEQKYQLTRQCLELLNRYEYGAAVITKSDLVLRDLPLFAQINEKARAVVQVSLTCADDKLSQILEPGVCPSSRRYEVLKALQAAHVPTVVWLSPLLPWITDTEENLKTLLSWCFDARVSGIVFFGVGMTLREGDREYYYDQLDRKFPGLSARYRQTYGDTYEIKSPEHGRLSRLFEEACGKYGVPCQPDQVMHDIMDLPERFEQISLF